MGEHVPVQSATSDRAVVHSNTTVGRSGPTSRPSLPDNTLIDYITGETIAETPKEQVRQRIARALFHEYGVAVEDLQRIAVCKPEPKNGNTVTRIRTPRQAEEDLAELRDLMGDERTPGVCYGIRKTLRHLLNRWREAAGTVGLPDTEEQSVEYQARLESYDLPLIAKRYREFRQRYQVPGRPGRGHE